MYNEIRELKLQAMKDKDVFKKDFYSTFMGEIQKEAKNKLMEPDNKMVLVIAKKMANNIKSNIELYTKKGLDISKEYKELTYLSAYLPKVLDLSDTVIAVEAAFDNTNAKSMKDFGKVMGYLKKTHGNNIDMTLASKLAKQKKMDE